MSLHTCYCLRCPCYVIMRSQLTFLHTPFASSVFMGVNKDFYLFRFFIVNCDLRLVCILARSAKEVLVFVVVGWFLFLF